jgi:hypothetical protein
MQTPITFDEASFQFVRDWDEGKHPTLTDYAKRYPQFVGELVGFVLEFVAIENAAARVPESDREPIEALEILEKVKREFLCLEK